MTNGHGHIWTVWGDDPKPVGTVENEGEALGLIQESPDDRYAECDCGELLGDDND